MVIFEVYFVPGADIDSLFSKETLKETQAQVMTFDDARKVGFSGLPEPPPGKEMRLVAVAKRDNAWIHRALETSEIVASFRVHHVD